MPRILTYSWESSDQPTYVQAFWLLLTNHAVVCLVFNVMQLIPVGIHSGSRCWADVVMSEKKMHGKKNPNQKLAEISTHFPVLYSSNSETMAGHANIAWENCAMKNKLIISLLASQNTCLYTVCCLYARYRVCPWFLPVRLCQSGTGNSTIPLNQTWSGHFQKNNLS